MTERQELPPEATCIGCGCKDSRACSGGCSWMTVDRELKAGVCNNCSKHLAVFYYAQRLARKTSPFTDFLDCLKAAREMGKGKK